MVPSKVEVSLLGDSLIIKTDRAPEILKGMHRIFFLNILEFEISDEPPGYKKNNSGIHKVLLDAVKYLNNQETEVEFNSEAREVILNIQEEAKKLIRSKVIGATLKNKKINSIIVPGLKRELKKYQIPAVAHLVNIENGANFSVPGSGKTSVVLAAYSILKSRDEVDKLVVIGPRSSFMPWEEEYYECFHKKPSVFRLTGSIAARRHLHRDLSSSEIILMSYQMACNESEELIKLFRNCKSFLVLDESHNIKRFEGGIWSDTIISLAPYAKRRAILSGTPVPNSILDLWSQTTFLWPDNPPLGTKDRFRHNIDKDEKSALKEIKENLYPLYWRVRKKDLNLPKPYFHYIKVKMKPYQKAVYNTLAVKVLSDIIKEPEERSKLRDWRKAKMVRLLQAASNPSLLSKYSEEFKIPPINASGLSIEQVIAKYPNYEMPAKIEAAVKLVRELVKNNQKVIIWTSFIHNIKTLQKVLSDLGPDVIYGEIPKDEDEDEEFNREKIINEFKTSPKHKILIANPSACSESISLHKVCFHAIYLDRTFNGAHYLQSLDRIHRVGLDKNDKVNYWILKCSDTIDEVIDARLKDKKKRMIQLLEKDFSVLDLDSSEEEFSEDTEEDEDFKMFVKHLKDITKEK